MTVAQRTAEAAFRLLSPRGARGRLIVLTYHSVPSTADELAPGEADADTFEQHVRLLANTCRILPLPSAVEALQSGDLPDRAVCITFDDGYVNNHEVAAPILKRHGATATFFVTRDAVVDGIMWNDLVIEAVRMAGIGIDLSAAGLSNDKVDRGFGTAALVESILTQMKYLAHDERLPAARRLFEAVSSRPPPRLMMTESQISELAREGFEIGAHTMSHPILAGLDDSRARFEIQECASWLTRLTGRKPVAFAYPNGRPGRDYHDAHVAMVRETGFQVAVTTAWGLGKRGADRLQIPRASLPVGSTRSQIQGLLKLLLSSYLRGA